MTIGSVETQFFSLNHPFELESGESLEQLTLAYETYGCLNGDASNAILLFHALTGSQHAAGRNAAVAGVDDLWTSDCYEGWWDSFIGPGAALDTEQYFIICVNYLGSCYGSTGPRSPDPQTGQPYGSRFPSITAWDVVHSQLKLLDHLKIDRLHGVVGGSLGGMLSLLLATRCPERVKYVIPLATGPATTVLQRILNLEQIVAIRNDPHFQGGDFYGGEPPNQGVTLARIIAHKTFVSLSVLEGRARKDVVTERIGNFYELSNPIESYMLHQGRKFAQRFDANSYLRIVDLWQRYSLGTEAETFVGCVGQEYLVFSIDSDVCFYPEEQLAIVQALEQAGLPVTYITVHSAKGHDSFLLEPELYAPYIRFVLRGNVTA
ncbi:MAG: homoserine O-acetyltransferase [Synechococcales cyanobacterium RM1_1_8]|nr:homoserine O-acetyltransferase [Synechococcales cyanobacterium RM1_1_8]